MSLPYANFTESDEDRLIQRQVLQDLVEQVVQELEEEVSRLLPPPMPKDEKSFWTPLLLQEGQETSFSPPIRIRVSK